MIFFRNQQKPRISSLLRTAIITGIVLIPQSAAGLKMKGLKGVTVDENTYYDADAGHATFKGTIDQGDTFANDIKLGPVVDEEG